MHGEISRKDRDIFWKVSLGVIALSIIVYGYLFSENKTSNIAYLIGFYLPIALIIWVIFYFVALKKRGSKIVSLSFLVIYGSLIASGFLAVLHQKKEAEKALTEIQHTYSKVIESSTDSEGFPQRIEKRIDTIPKSTGEFKEIERYMKEYMDQIVALRNDYLLELNAIGWESILDPNRIHNDKNFTESKVILKRVKEIIRKYRMHTNDLLQETKDKIDLLNISASFKKSMLEGFERGMVKSKQQIDAVWNLEEEVASEVENIVNLLDVRKGTWIVQGGQILFYNDHDLHKFNSYIASIQRTVNEQQEIQKKCIESVSRNFNNIREGIK
jgi:hypothetical protein